MLVVLLVLGIPILVVIYKICAGLKVEEPRKKKKSKKEEAEEADDPMAWFAGKLNEMAMAREEAKAAKKQEAQGLTPHGLWDMLDLNKDGLLSMGEFKKGVQKNESLQYLLCAGKNSDVTTMKAVFKKMHVRHPFAFAIQPTMPVVSCETVVRAERDDASVCLWRVPLLPAGPSQRRGTDHQGALLGVLECS